MNRAARAITDPAALSYTVVLNQTGLGNEASPGKNRVLPCTTIAFTSMAEPNGWSGSFGPVLSSLRSSERCVGAPHLDVEEKFDTTYVPLLTLI